jgi:hypothetical protein
MLVIFRNFIVLFIFAFLLINLVNPVYGSGFEIEYVEGDDDCSEGYECLFIINGRYEGGFTINGHVTGCSFAQSSHDSGYMTTKVCGSSLTDVSLNDDVVDGKCGVNGILSFTNNTVYGGHVQGYLGPLNYQYHVCLEPRVGCSVRHSCLSGESCVIGMTNFTNAHAYQCDSFSAFSPYNFEYRLCCNFGYVKCDKVDGKWWDGSGWSDKSPDGCSCDFDSDCLSGLCVNYQCLEFVSDPIQLIGLENKYDMYIGQSELIIFSLKNNMPIDIETVLSVDPFSDGGYSGGNLYPFVWLEGHKFSENRYSLDVDLEANEIKTYVFVVEPAPRVENDVPYKLVFSADNIYGSDSKEVEFNINLVFDPGIPLTDRAQVPDLSIVSLFIIILTIFSYGVFRIYKK